MNFKRIMCIAATAALVLVGSTSSALTTKAENGYEWAPCPYCRDGLVWRSEEPYRVLLGTRICIDGYVKGTDAHYENRVRISRECRDCEMLREYWTESRGTYWKCEGYNVTPGIQ